MAIRHLPIWLCMAGIAASNITVTAADNQLSRPAGDAAPQNFREFCAGDLPAQQLSRFESQFELAQQQFAAGRLEEARSAFAFAQAAAFRGGAESDMSVKCLGEPLFRRWFDLKLQLMRAVAPEQPAAHAWPLYVAAADRGADGVIEQARATPDDRFATAFQNVSEIARVIDAERRYGAFILPAEASIETACKKALGPLREYAKQRTEQALAAEEYAFTRPPTAVEQQGMQTLGTVGQMTQAMAGVSTDYPEQRDMLLIRAQTDESREKLETARAFQLEPPAVAGHDAAGQRAKKRGEALFRKAGDSTHSLQFRDDLYATADRYFRFCQCDDQRAAARAAREAIQPALAAEEAQREQKMEAAADRMKNDAERAMQDMQKTESEKQSFKDEADAMEAELGF